MNSLAVKGSVLIVLGGLLACNNNKAQVDKPMELDNQSKKVSYSLGVSIAKNLKQQKFDSVDVPALTQAIKDAYGSGKLLIDEAQANEILNNYIQGLNQKKLDANLEAGRKFLEENKTKEGVVTLASGLQYKVLIEGKGPKPAATDKVTTHYTGTLINGTVFDSSVERGQPATFPVNGVIAGWTEALQLMNTGSKWQLFIPAEIAYGANPRPGGPIEPNMALVFEVELISINK